MTHPIKNWVSHVMQRSRKMQPAFIIIRKTTQIDPEVTIRQAHQDSYYQEAMEI